jgi:hypothetical protein
MRVPSSKVVQLKATRRPAATPVLPSCVSGRVVRLSETGRPLVDFPCNTAGPVPARSLLARGETVGDGAAVLLVFENGDPALPVILGHPGESAAEATPLAARAGLDSPQDVHVKTKRLIVEAGEEITLRCGKGSLTFQPDGTIVVRGTNLLSRSSGPNRIKGATVRIN